jgi:hypothetical protein
MRLLHGGVQHVRLGLGVQVGAVVVRVRLRAAVSAMVVAAAVRARAVWVLRVWWWRRGFSMRWRVVQAMGSSRRRR